MSSASRYPSRQHRPILQTSNLAIAGSSPAGRTKINLSPAGSPNISPTCQIGDRPLHLRRHRAGGPLELKSYARIRKWQTKRTGIRLLTKSLVCSGGIRLRDSHPRPCVPPFETAIESDNRPSFTAKKESRRPIFQWALPEPADLRIANGPAIRSFAGTKVCRLAMQACTVPGAEVFKTLHQTAAAVSRVFRSVALHGLAGSQGL